jgi:hypothetical protein
MYLTTLGFSVKTFVVLSEIDNFSQRYAEYNIEFRREKQYPNSKFKIQN